MLSDAQREVAIHLLANAIRQAHLRDPAQLLPGNASSPPAGAAVAARRTNEEEAYLRGMFDMLRGLYGATGADELYRAARALERSPKGH